MLDLLPGRPDGVAGVTLHVMGEGQQDGVGACWCRAVVLATGGLGQVFSSTTNPSVSTGDGVALALRAGARSARPRVRAVPPDRAVARRRRPGAAAAGLRGGARRGRLPRRRRRRAASWRASTSWPTSPRATSSRRRSCGGCASKGSPHMWLDARHLGEERWAHAVPDHPGRLPRARHRPGHRADPGRAGLPLRVRWRRDRPRRPHDGARALRLRRGRLHRRARREPARLQLPARGAGLRRAGSPPTWRRRPARLAAAPVAGPTGRQALVDAARRTATCRRR